ncbi:LacI family transcriptional regulator [Planosporangium flavigriseum]|uniref:LacI family transcriptional regulator n=1 Tax=Planosporangium flavigriseum TaxID=373681 RepID=A0A8J3LYL2_9ACTN|nr:LacI family DNA-binding transcriptional regulator [Planosporangium flavigriseum]NJC66597.1 LacI family transcriptional regulator [Planosporangium flavigriseum]GIG73470.1 LacI family transcriptional regulator [Planosporangium flavigriseum]
MERTARPTIRDVADRAGVSVATVSKVINRRYGVAAATYAHVMRVVEEIGYQASLVAQSLRNSQTMVIGVLVADLEPFSTELLKGVADAIRGTGYELLVYSASGLGDSHDGWERRSLSRLSGTLIDGAVVVTPTVVDVNFGTPVVAVDPHTGTSALPTVVADNLKGAVLATEHLIGLGHTRIAMVTGRPDLESARLREQGFRRAMKRAGIPVDEMLVVRGDYQPEPSARAARRLLDAPARPTAVFAANDVSAIAVMEMARERGLAVPRDLSVVGFDNLPESALATPPLTTVEQPVRRMGREAVAMLLRLINGTDGKTQIRLPTRLVQRSTTAAPPPRGKGTR